jgi:cyanate permease
VLDGISAAVVAVMTPLVIADITRGTGRFNFTQGVYGTLIGIGAAVSTAASGFVVQHFGAAAGFLGLATVALAAAVILWLAMPETKPARYA